jgi:hypothetical protein
MSQKCQLLPCAVQQRYGYSITSSVCSRNESEMATRLAGGFKLDIGNPIALAPAQAGLFILALEG